MNIIDLPKAADLWAHKERAVQYLASITRINGDVEIAPGTFIDSDLLQRQTEVLIASLDAQIAELGAIPGQPTA